MNIDQLLQNTLGQTHDFPPFSRNFMEFTPDPGMSPTLVIGRKRIVQGFELLTALPILG
jgi:hypothetical protein